MRSPVYSNDKKFTEETAHQRVDKLKYQFQSACAKPSSKWIQNLNAGFSENLEETEENIKCYRCGQKLSEK